MARPTKNSCDYFPHDTGMRNHKKIKAIRNKFGITGYAIWVMFLELLTGSDGNVFEDCPLEIELLSGDFGVSCEEIRAVLDYCYSLELLFINQGFVSSESLDERLLPVYEKREKSKDMSAKQRRLLGKFISNNETVGVSVTETTEVTDNSVTVIPQSKVNKSKVNKTDILLEKESKFNLKKTLIKLIGDENLVSEYLQVRKLKKLANTETAFKDLLAHCEKNNFDLAEAIRWCVKKSWGGFNIKWLEKEPNWRPTSQLTLPIQQPKQEIEWWRTKYPNRFNTYEEFDEAYQQGIIDPFTD